MNFLTKVERISLPVVDLEDIARMKAYQLSLIDIQLYQPATAIVKNKIVHEIIFTEIWLKRETKIFVNDNNRRYEPTIKHNHGNAHNRTEAPIVLDELQSPPF